MENGDTSESIVDEGKNEKTGAPKWLLPVLLGCGCLFGLLVVLGAFVVMVPGAMRISEKIREMTARSDSLQLKSSIGSYFTEYRKYPDFPPSEGGDCFVDSGAKFLSVVQAEDNTRNPRQIVFFAGKPANPGGEGGWRNGIHYGESGPELYDPWGNFYLIAWDANCDDQVANPDPMAAKTTPFIPGGVIVWSAGPDGDSDTWADNLTTWGRP